MAESSAARRSSLSDAISAAAGLAVTMLGAIVFVHLSGGLFLPNGSEFALSLLGAVTLLALAGAGAFSIDALIGRQRARA